MNTEIATNLHHLIGKGGTGLRFFNRKGVISSEPTFYKIVEMELLEYIERHKSDGGAVRVGSLSPLVDIAVRAGIIKPGTIMFYYSLYDYDDFANKLGSETFRDPTGTIAMMDLDRAEEHIPTTRFSTKSRIKYIYSDKVNILFMLGTIEGYMMDNAKDIAKILHNLQAGK